MKKLIVIVFLLLCTSGIFAQSKTDSIEIRKNFFGTTFRQQGKILKPSKLKKIILLNDEANKELKKANVYLGFGSVISFAGGGLMGWPLGANLAGKKMDWTMFAVGAGLTLVSIPFSIAALNHTKKSVEIYNHGIKQQAQNQIDFKFGLNTNGVGLTVIF